QRSCLPSETLNPMVRINEESAYFLSYHPVYGLNALAYLVSKYPIVNEFLFFPPSQGSVKEKLYDLNCLPLLWARRLSFCPSPTGKGFQAFLFQILLIEKLLNTTPSVPVSPIPPPNPAESSNWSDDFST